MQYTHILIFVLTRNQQQRSDNNNMRFSSCYHIAATALVVVVLSSPNANAFQNNNVQTRTTPATPLTNRPPRSLSSSPSSSSFSQLLMAKDPKETTWERITGPKLFKTVTNWQVRTYVTALFPLMLSFLYLRSALLLFIINTVSHLSSDFLLLIISL